MRRKVVNLFFSFCLFTGAFIAYGQSCIPLDTLVREYWDITLDCTIGGGIGGLRGFTKSQDWDHFWPCYPPYTCATSRRTTTGRSLVSRNPVTGNTCMVCWADFYTPIRAQRFWKQDVYEVFAMGPPVLENLWPCDRFDYPKTFSWGPPYPACICPPTPPQPPCAANQTCQTGCQWSSDLCRWENCGNEYGSPIIIDLNNDGYDLTNAANGVRFDLEALGTRKQWSWTERRSDDAFLALDRDGDGRITNGKELFGNFTDQPTTEEPNGFVALAVFDDNNDRWIDKDDAVYRRLLLWVDSNHDGASQRSELHSLDWGGVDGIGLDYRVSKRSDQYGNNFKYRAPVRGRDLGRWAWDVFLVTQ